MSEAGGDDLLTATVILLGAGVTGLVLFRRLGFGSVLGLLIVGMLLGPYGLGFATGGTELEGVAEIGVVFLLFLIGLEMQPETLWGMRRAVFGLGGLQVTVSGGGAARTPSSWPWPQTSQTGTMRTDRAGSGGRSGVDGEAASGGTRGSQPQPPSVRSVRSVSSPNGSQIAGRSLLLLLPLPVPVVVVWVLMVMAWASLP